MNNGFIAFSSTRYPLYLSQATQYHLILLKIGFDE